eukprot:m.2736 g.2736  ORF g.2736 m.2736 type:complete len:138 (+) comp8870_c0_seq1:81-494(+)
MKYTVVFFLLFTVLATSEGWSKKPIQSLPKIKLPIFLNPKCLAAKAMRFLKSSGEKGLHILAGVLSEAFKKLKEGCGCNIERVCFGSDCFDLPDGLCRLSCNKAFDFALAKAQSAKKRLSDLALRVAALEKSCKESR